VALPNENWQRVKVTVKAISNVRAIPTEYSLISYHCVYSGSWRQFCQRIRPTFTSKRSRL